MVCSDKVVEWMPKNKNRPKNWGPGNNPMTALKEFHKHNDRFIIDSEIENKLLLSCNYKGYLKAIK